MTHDAETISAARQIVSDPATFLRVPADMREDAQRVVFGPEAFSRAVSLSPAPLPPADPPAASHRGRGQLAGGKSPAPGPFSSPCRAPSLTEEHAADRRAQLGSAAPATGEGCAGRQGPSPVALDHEPHYTQDFERGTLAKLIPVLPDSPDVSAWIRWLLFALLVIGGLALLVTIDTAMQKTIHQHLNPVSIEEAQP